MWKTLHQRPDVPSLSDLVVLWLQERIGEGHRIQCGSSWDPMDVDLKIDGTLIGWIYDDTMELVLSDVAKRLNAADPEFFDKLWLHIEKVSETFDPLYQTKLTTYKEKL